MDNLPIELLPFIFKHLGLVDLLRSRSVCKKWRFFIDEQKIKKLIFYDGSRGPYWVVTTQLINLGNTIRLDTYEDGSSFQNFFEHHLINLNQLTDLKRLQISTLKLSDYFFPMFLNKFTKLEQLDCDGLNLNEGEINHQNLRIISLTHIYFGNVHQNRLKINAPKLKILIYEGCIQTLELVYPNRLVEFHIGNCKDHEELDLTPYSNVEILKCNFLRSNQNIISVLPKLKELHCQYDFSSYNTEIHTQVKNVMNNLLEKNQNLNKSVKIYFQDLLLSNQADLKLFDESLDILREELLLQIKNYDLLSKSNLNYLNYTNLMEQIVKNDYFLNSSINNKLPNDFFNRFQNITYIDTKEIQDQNHFSWFLKNCTNLIHLIMNNSSIDQNFCNKLPELCKQLTCFELNLTGYQIINFDFILKFNRLTIFATNQRVPISQVIESIRTFKHLYVYVFHDYNSNSIEIWKRGFKFDLKTFNEMDLKGRIANLTKLSSDDLILKLTKLSTITLD